MTLNNLLKMFRTIIYKSLADSLSPIILYRQFTILSFRLLFLNLLVNLIVAIDQIFLQI